MSVLSSSFLMIFGLILGFSNGVPVICKFTNEIAVALAEGCGEECARTIANHYGLFYNGPISEVQWHNFNVQRCMYSHTE